MALIDHLIAVPVTIHYWWHGLFEDRCKLSPDGRTKLQV